MRCVNARPAWPDAGLVDVLDLATGQRVDTDAFHSGLQSIPAPGVWRAMSYIRQ